MLSPRSNPQPDDAARVPPFSDLSTLSSVSKRRAHGAMKVSQVGFGRSYVRRGCRAFDLLSSPIPRTEKATQCLLPTPNRHSWLSPPHRNLPFAAGEKGWSEASVARQPSGCLTQYRHDTPNAQFRCGNWANAIYFE